MTSDAAPGYLSADDCRLADLIDLVSQKTDQADYPYAAAVEQNLLIYDGARLRKELSSPAGRWRVEAELARALRDGPGIVVLAGRWADPWIVDRATREFDAIIAKQKAAGAATGDHFAAAGHQRPDLGRAGEAGPARAGGVRGLLRQQPHRGRVPGLAGAGYQVTSTINVVNPGGAAQTAHRDYHLGFASAERAARFPAARAPAVAGADLAGRGGDIPRRLGPARPCTCRIRRSTCRATWPGGSLSSGSTSRPTTCSCRWPRGTWCSSTRPCSTRPAQSHRRGQAHGQPARRCRRRSGGPWRPSTGARCPWRCSRRYRVWPAAERRWSRAGT